MTNTTYNYITDKTAIHSMNFHNINISENIGERFYIPDGTTVTAVVGQTTFSFKLENWGWSDEVFDSIRQMEKYVLAKAHYNHLYLDRVEKAIKDGKDIPKWNLKIMFVYTGRTLPHKERKPILPLTAEQSAARITRNRAELGLD